MPLRGQQWLIQEGESARTIAALFVDERGRYAGRRNVEVWGELQDARTYPGPHPVVAHPVCSRWCRLAGLTEARWGYRRGEDDGCFEAALDAVRTWGGVLEHPAYSDAFEAFGLPRPDRFGGWSAPDRFGGRACHVEQCRYGHRAKKATWLLCRRDRHARAPVGKRSRPKKPSARQLVRQPHQERRAPPEGWEGGRLRHAGRVR